MGIPLPSNKVNPETVNIGVTVTTEDNSSVQGAVVSLTKGTEEYTGVTGSAGGCNIKNVPTGQYELNIDYNDGTYSYMLKTVNGASSSTLEVSSTTTSLQIVIQKE